MTNHTPEYILFGAGAAGRKAMDVFGAERIRCFCDNAKSGELYQGKPVIGIEKLKKCHKSFSVVITIANKSLFLQVARQLMEVGIPFTSYEEEIKKNYPLAWLHFEGDYVSWQQAEASLAEYAEYAKGYAEANILNQVSTAIQKVRNGEAVFERDGVLFDDEEYNTGLLSGLFFVATLLSGRGGQMSILDYGGGLGSTFFQNRKLFTAAGCDMQWNIIEQLPFVEEGRRTVPEISFYDDVETFIVDKRHCDTILLSGFLQYVNEPYAMLDKILSLRAEFVLIDRMPLLYANKDRLCLQYVPPDIYKAIYPVWLISEVRLKDQLNSYGYQKVFKWQDNEAMPVLQEDGTVEMLWYQGALFQLCKGS